MEEHFNLCRAFGFKTMEIGIGGGQIGRLPEKMTEAEIADFRKMGDSYGITTPFCCIENDFTLSSPGDHDRMLTSVTRQLRLVAKLGASQARLFAGFMPLSETTEETWRQMLAAFSRCAEVCAEVGITAAIETHGRITMREGVAFHESTVTTDRAALQRLMDSLPGQIGFNFDPGNIKAAAPNDVALCLDIINDRITYCHLKDWKRQNGGWTAAAPGDDDLDYATLLPKMKYDGIYLIEYEPVNDVQEGIARSLAYLRNALGNIVLE
ncbi:MAG: sugar phosphate isomerase/epimerase family protein [Victivallales bacterium]